MEESAGDVFGTIDWAWVHESLRGWAQLFGNHLPAVVLVVQPYHTTRYLAVRKHYLHSRVSGNGRKKKKPHRSRRLEEEWLRTATEEERSRHASQQGIASDSYIEVPAFFSRHGDHTAVVDAALLPEVVPNVVRQGRGSVMVLGSSNIGKSTLCRFLANALLSLHGRCFWLDLDLGQPEFGVPGQLTLYRVRRPLLRPHDTAAAELVRAYFLSSSYVACPLSTAQALVHLCELARGLAERHPVVVNTHGWVLHTGRRTTVEAIRRLLPRVIVHLKKPEEDAWAQDTDALLDPKEGLNGSVVGNRFLVRRFSRGRELGAMASTPAGPNPVIVQSIQGGDHPYGKGGGANRSTPASAEKNGFLGKLPSAFAKTFTSNGEDASKKLKSLWKGIVHTVRVVRDVNVDADRTKRTSGRAGREALWQAYFKPLIEHYESVNGENTTKRQGETTSEANAIPDPDPAAATMLLKAPLHALHSIVLVERDEKEPAEPLYGGSYSSTTSSSCISNDFERPLLENLAARLEHAVVAVQLSSVNIFPAPASPAGVGGKGGGGVVSNGPNETGPSATQVVSLANLPNGFQVSLYGYVESTEQELLAGQIAIRLPIKRDVMERFMTKEYSMGISETSRAQTKGHADKREGFEASGTATPSSQMRISIAFSEVLQGDTCFMEGYP
ncbi:unnamed protein product [Phytomonas sp. Hart1]|nr:unnamed protein product [Phytomonas sp. Hart1]|eukprot:CCW71666.1 unnamed protein product [Phytomonas sp. isolate Hart1]